MAKLNFLFAGESIQSSRLQSKTRKFELVLERNTILTGHSPVFSIEYFFSINSYAENLSEAFHMAAKEAGIAIRQLNIQITGKLDSDLDKKENAAGNIFNRIEISLHVASDAPEEALAELLNVANALNPIEESIADHVGFRFSLNSVIHLN